MAMEFLEWGALIVGAGLSYTGVRAIRSREAYVPEHIQGDRAVRLGTLWIVLGVLFILSTVFDIALLKSFFRLFLEAAN